MATGEIVEDLRELAAEVQNNIDSLDSAITRLK